MAEPAEDLARAIAHLQEERLDMGYADVGTATHLLQGSTQANVLAKRLIAGEEQAGVQSRK